MRTYTALERVGGGWIYNANQDCRDTHFHETETEARVCYSEYLKTLVDMDSKSSSWHGCIVCGAPTKRWAEIRVYMGDMVPLCDEHRTEEIAFEKLHLNEPSGDRFVS